MTLLQSAVIALQNGGKNAGETNCGNEELVFLACAIKEGKKKTTPDAVRVKQPRCQEKAIFEFGFRSNMAHSTPPNCLLSIQLHPHHFQTQK